MEFRRISYKADVHCHLANPITIVPVSVEQSNCLSSERNGSVLVATLSQCSDTFRQQPILAIREQSKRKRHSISRQRLRLRRKSREIFECRTLSTRCHYRFEVEQTLRLLQRIAPHAGHVPALGINYLTCV